MTLTPKIFTSYFFRNLLVAFTIILMASPGCQFRKVTRDGVKMNYNEAAALDFKEAEKAYAQRKKSEAVKILKESLKKYPSSSYADQMEMKLGDIYLSEKKYEKAEKYYRSVTKNYRFSKLKNRASFRLSVCLVKQEKYAQVPDILVPIANRYTQSLERLEVYHFISLSYEKTEQREEALPFYVSMIQIYRSQSMDSEVETPYSTIPRKETLEKRVIQIIQQSTQQKFLRKVISFYGDRFPAQYALIRLGSLQIADGNQSLAEANLEELISRFPNDPLVAEARLLLRRLQSRFLVNENHIGVILPLTGPHANFGNETLEGIELAVSLLKDSYPDIEIEFIVKDSMSKPEQAAKMVNELVVDDQVIAILGPLFAQTSMAAAKEAQALGVTMVSFSSDEKVPEVGDYIFQNALTNQDQVRALVQYAMKTQPDKNDPELAKRKGRFAILYPNHSYGNSMRDFFWDEVEKQGGQIVGCESYKPRQTDFRTEMKKLVGLYYKEPRKEDYKEMHRVAKEKGKRKRDLELPPIVDFEALFIPDYYAPVTLIADYLPYFNIKNVILLGASNWNHPKLLERSSKNLRGAVFTDGFFLQSEQTETSAYVSNYRRAFDKAPKRHSAFAYDSVHMLISLLQNTSDANRENFKDKLNRLDNYQGVTRVKKDPFLLKVEGDQIVEIKASSR